jgi:uncharacterized protein YndB with AHSA1/START domain
MKFGAGVDSLTLKSNHMEETKKHGSEEISLQSALVIRRVINHPVKKVWRALTVPEEFKKWFGPKGFTCPTSKMEARVGGKYLNCMRGPDGKEYWSTGVVKEFIPEKKLVVTDSFSDANGNIKTAAENGLPGDWPRELLITYELEDANGATKLTLHHEGIPDEMYEECKKSWNETFDKLEENI